MLNYVWVPVLVDVAQIIAAVFVGVELFRIFTETKREHVRQMKLQTLDMANHKVDILEESNRWIIEKAREGYFENPEALTETDIVNIRYYLNRVERLATGAKHAIYSVEVIRDISSTSLRSRFLALAKFIRHRREAHGNPKSWVEFEWLVFELELISEGKVFPSGWQFGDNDATVRSTSQSPTSK